jgi:dihydroorotate dehydrogenase
MKEQTNSRQRRPTRFFISAPFGNYIKPKGAIPVCGTFTLNPRGNRLWSVAKSLRYNTKFNGWTNKLGLPNPGIEKGLKRHVNGEVISIAEIEVNDFVKIQQIIPDSHSVELNLSCPNVDKILTWESCKVFTKLNSLRREWCIGKVSPLTTPEELKFLIDEIGFRQIHISNTLPLSGNRGGVSGPVLIPYTLELIDLIRETWGESITIVAGGGVTDFGGVMRYLGKGANHVSIGSVCFNPFKLRKLLKSCECV